MTNSEVKEKIDRLDAGGYLSLDEQKAICKSLLRANHRIRAAKKAGWVEHQHEEPELAQRIYRAA